MAQVLNNACLLLAQVLNNLKRIYRLATEEAYQFLYVNLRATNVNDMFSLDSPNASE